MEASYPAARSLRLQRFLTRFFQYFILLIVVVIIFVPLVILIFGSLKTTGEMYSHPYRIPNPPHWENLVAILSTPTFWRLLRNSVVLMLAINVAILPVYFVLRQMNEMGITLIDSLVGVILVQIAFNISGNILILRGFFTAIPTELQDAAYIDGCNNFDFFWRILLPLARPALAAVAALTMIVSWNDLLVPLVVLNSEELWTLPLGTMQFQGQYGQDLALVSAFVALSAIPTLIFYLFAERQIISGLTAG